MKMLEQILKEMGVDTVKSITLVPGSCCYLKSVKSVVEFSAEKIVLAVGKMRITLEGEKLQIAKYFEADILVNGDIRELKID